MDEGKRLAAEKVEKQGGICFGAFICKKDIDLRKMILQI